MVDTLATSGEPLVEVRGLARHFKGVTALENVDLSIVRGGVFGLVGENGAGKTTLIKHLLGLFRAQEGFVRVFGLDPVQDPEQVLVRIGYLSEDRNLPGWMRVSELMRYMRSFYPNWDPEYAEELRDTFELDPHARLRTLSRGQLAKAGLLAALAHRPELLVLDEPSSGLDPIVRRDILAAIIRTVADEGRTVLFSSHLLDEVERVADRVAMIYHGRIVLNTTMEQVRDGYHRLVLRALNGHLDLSRLPGLLHASHAGRETTVVCQGELEAIKRAAAEGGGEVVDTASPSLEDVFVAQVASKRKRGQDWRL